MSDKNHQFATPERNVSALPGWPMLFLTLFLMLGAVAYLIYGASHHAGPRILAVFFPAELLGILLLTGFFTLQPNEARVLILFGNYKGTVRTSGFHWANPLYSRGKMPAGTAVINLHNPLNSAKLSLRAHNLNSGTLKVNDKRGNPVEIAAVVVWRVHNTAQAAFDVEDYTRYVQVQSESAVRSIASRFAYDHGDENELTLRGGADEVSLALKDELQVRLAKAGVVVDEARLTHLAYAPEIASIMLRRQQAEAIIAARQMIVHNAVGMVQMALTELDDKNVVKLDEERKAAMVSNLLVVLCGNSDASPVINTGTLYS
jgi:regulator of protease activity HflC (stomatin/prohibitin superfamily)